ncbi:HD domain-containing protein [bacterium]|nr:HD domain-containing protein [bacterium]MBU1993692.1 HD domain-containing protein [bacterium]
MKKQSIKKITLTRLLQVFVVAMLVIVSIGTLSYRMFFEFIVENKIISISEIVQAGLTSHMKAGIMDKRDYFLREISSVYDIESIKIIRSDAVMEQFGASASFEKKLNNNLRMILDKKEAYFQWNNKNNRLEAIVPYIANSQGVLNCLECHHVADGEVLGAVDISINTQSYQDFLFRNNYIIATVLLVFALVIILNMFHVIERYIRKPLSRIIDDGKKAYESSQDIQSDVYESQEFEDVVQNINKFNQNIIEKEKELLAKNVELRMLNEEIESTLKETLFAMGQMEEIRSLETKRHTQRVAILSALIAKDYGLDRQKIKLIELASPLHDIGKIGITDAVLNKPAPLSDEEFTLMKTHPGLGYEMLRHSQRAILQVAASIAYEHHERYDGTGYPQGLKAEEITVFARIVAIVDVIDALLSQRVYKDIWPLEKVIELLKEEKGKHFDPKIVDVVLENIDEYALIIRNLSQEI